MKEYLDTTLLNQISDGTIITDPEGKIVYFNQSAIKNQHLGRQPMQIGALLTDLVSLERREIVKHIIKEVNTRKTTQISEAEYKDKTGRSFFFEVSYSPILGDSEEPVGILVIGHEITHHKTFEKKSVQLIGELSSLIENANALIFSVDSREYITEWNKECIRVTHFEKNEVLAQKIDALIADSSQESFTKLFKSVLQGEPISNQELLIKKKDDGSLTLLVNATPKVSSTQHVVGVLFVGQDITELSQYRNSLEEKVKDRTEKLKAALEKEKELVDLKNRFVAVASHEFKMPLSSIDVSVNSLKASQHLSADEKKKLENIETQVGFMKGMLEDVLTFKKGEENKLQANLKAVDLTDFLRQLMSEVAANAGHSHRFRSLFQQQPVLIESDEKLLRNIFLNLLGNAIKFSPGKQLVDVSVSLLENMAVVTIRDYGIGVDERDIKRVFEPFNRGSNASDIKGTGLGLSIVKRAVETLHGAIDMQSVLNEGTTFVVKLKLKT